MATTEYQPLSIQQRIAALNQSEVGRVPGISPPPTQARPTPAVPATRPNLTQRHKAAASHGVHGSVAESLLVRDEQGILNKREILPPPDIAGLGSKSPGLDKPKRPPPPLPARKKHSELSPALPPRRSSGQPILKNSEDLSSITSSSPRSAGTDRHPSARSTSAEAGVDRLRAPAWGEAVLPPLPPKRNDGVKPVARVSGTLARSVLSADINHKTSLPSISAPAPRLPPRPSSTSTPGELHDPASPRWANDEEAKSSQRKLPPTSSAAALEKIKVSSFATLSRHAKTDESAAYGALQTLEQDQAPPIPSSSRPDLSKIQFANPGITPTSSTTSTTTSCMKCRDFSGPDTYAAQFPRETLPSQDLAWLANQLTSPFPSPTDKARALFTWLHHNISYDVDSFFNNRVQPSTPSSTLSRGLAVCEGYAGLFATLAKHAGLEARVISGHGKGFGYTPVRPGSPLPPFSASHAWNVVRIDDGQWKLVDACWGAGHVNGEGQSYTKWFSPKFFTMSNDEFGLRHYPTDKSQFYRDDGRASIAWEEYILIDHSRPEGMEPPTIFTGAEEEHGIGERTLEPRSKAISLHQAAPLRFQFRLICEHWTVTEHSKKSAPYVYALAIHGLDGRKDEYVAFQHVRGSGPSGGGDFWYADIADPRTLGAPGQKLTLYAVTSFGDLQDARGLTTREFKEGLGRKAMGFSGVAQWNII